MEKIPNYPRDIIVPAETEINTGKHEDGESFFTNQPTTLRIIGPISDNAYPVLIVENGEEGRDLFFFHQPEP